MLCNAMSTRFYRRTCTQTYRHMQYLLHRFAFPALKPPEPFKVTKTTRLAQEMQAESADQASRWPLWHVLAAVLKGRMCSRGSEQAPFCTLRLQKVVFPTSRVTSAYALQVAAACDQWRQAAEGNVDQPTASTSGAPQLPFWLLAKAPEGKWQAAPLTAFADVSFLWTMIGIITCQCTAATSQHVAALTLYLAGATPKPL